MKKWILALAMTTISASAFATVQLECLDRNREAQGIFIQISGTESAPSLKLFQSGDKNEVYSGTKIQSLLTEAPVYIFRKASRADLRIEASAFYASDNGLAGRREYALSSSDQKKSFACYYDQGGNE